MASSKVVLVEPFENCVYQRDKSNMALIPVSGTVPTATQTVRAILTPIQEGRTTPIEQMIPVDKDGNFGGSIAVPGGWYVLTVQAGEASFLIRRVGAGEVFILFGHSFMQGGHDQSHQLPATDERSVTLLDDLTAQNNLFGKITKEVGPFHESPDYVGQLADKLVARLGVPVMFYGCAYGGSNILQTYQLLTGVSGRQLPPGAKEPTRQPFTPVEDVLTKYVPKTGVRAILMEHGYNDRGSDTATFETQFRYVMDYVRSQYSMPNLAIVLVQEQLTNVPGTLAAPNTAAGLANLLKTYPNMYKGPDFNDPQWSTMWSNNHLFGPAIDLFAAEWDKALSDSFFSTSTPYPAVGADVFPLVLYQAPTTSIKPFDWLLLAIMAACLFGILVYKKPYLMWAFLLLALIGLGRVTGKV
ncbi:hypothetical protein [Spirosoma pomorum]